ncbi:MAG: hypothetical protein FJ271_13435 [Planctomycetes bacterium]|nr:hypothetical protein [Planctomycetota bacterium]
MIDIWEWFKDKELEYEDQKDKARLAMARSFFSALDLQETNPRAMIAKLRQVRARAKLLGEPWWGFLSEVWLAQAYSCYIGDLREALRQALHCVHESRKLVLREHPWRLAAHNILLGCYVDIDVLGYAAAIRETLYELDREIPAGPNAHRYVMLGYQRRSLIEQGKLRQAEKNALHVLDLLDEDDNDDNSFYLLSPLHHLCWLCFKTKDWERVRAFAIEAEATARTRDTSEADIAVSQIWQATAERQAGDAARAKRLFRKAHERMKPLQAVPGDNYFDAVVAFHELGEDLDLAERAREQQLKVLEGKGQVGLQCDVRIKRCELLARLGRLARRDLDCARKALAPLKAPKAYEKRIRQLEKLMERAAPKASRSS